MVSKKTSANKYAVPGLSFKTGHRVAVILQGRLSALNDMRLTLKHAHWNVVGRVSTTDHLATLDIVYDGVTSSHRDALAATGPLTPLLKTC